jgi:signal transduction histidine kinase
MIRLTFLVFYFFSLCAYAGTNKILVLNSSSDQYHLRSNLLLAEASDQSTFNEINSKSFEKNFEPLTKEYKVSQDKVHWVKFVVSNNDSIDHEYKISIAFTDLISFYYSIDSGHYIVKKTGDLVPIEDRDIQNGKFVFVTLEVLKGETKTCFIKLESLTSVSKEFRGFALNSLWIYGEDSYREKFESSKIYQSFFFGAIIIMLFFNLFIFLRIRSSSYIYYVFYLFCLVVFFASNEGYLAELFFSHYPMVDIAVRFISAPVLIVSYLVFARSFLRARELAPALDKVINVFIAFLGISILMIIIGKWQLGRSIGIYTMLFSFPYIIYLAIIILKKGFMPARFFLAGNILLIIGALVFAIPKLFEVHQSSFTQFSLQLAALFEVALFSIGLADRISMMQKEISEAKLEKEIQERRVELERKLIIEEKNKELEKSNQELNTYIYRTAHDIRGPIARLMGLSKLALKDVTDAKAVDYFQKLDVNSNYLNYIITRLSLIHNINTREVQKHSFSIDKLVEETKSHLLFFEEYKRVDVKWEVERNANLISDYLLIKHILFNLAENAVKFSKKDSDGANVFIQIQKLNSFLHISVSDNGIGISEYDVPYLFDMFSKSAGIHQSPGLGLYIVKLCTDKLRGTITCNFNRIEGAEFVISIPITV